MQTKIRKCHSGKWLEEYETAAAKRVSEKVTGIVCLCVQLVSEGLRLLELTFSLA